MDCPSGEMSKANSVPSLVSIEILLTSVFSAQDKIEIVRKRHIQPKTDVLVEYMFLPLGSLIL